MLGVLIGGTSQAVTDYFLSSSPPLFMVSQSGCIGGTAFYVLNPADPAAVMSGSYGAYDNCFGLIVSGPVDATQGIYGFGRDRPEDFVSTLLSFSNLVYTRKADGATFRLSGTMRLARKPALLTLISTSFPGYRVTVNADLHDQDDALVLSLKDFVVDSDPRAVGDTAESIAFSGRLADPVLGVVDVVSPKRMIIALPGTAPSSGSFLIQGAAEQATVTYTGAAHTTSIDPLPLDNTALDASFGTGGEVITDFEGRADAMYAMARQPDGKIVAAGSSTDSTFFEPTFALARYNEDGSLDTSFGTGGKVRTAIGAGDIVTAVVVQADGKLVAAGATNVSSAPRNLALARYNTDGSLDPTFGSNGTVTTALSDAAVGAALLQPDGKLVVVAAASSDHFAVVRYNSDGSLDASFGSGGIVLTPGVLVGSGFAIVRDAILQPDGKIVLAGSFFGGGEHFELIRYNDDGSLDPGFGIGGKVEIPSASVAAAATGIVLQSDGKLIASGLVSQGTGNAFTLVRYNADGTIDTAFGNDGIASKMIDTGTSSSGNLVLQPDGKLVVIGTGSYGPNTRFILVRFLEDGAVDTRFGINGVVLTGFGNRDADGNVLLLQPDGKLVAGGTAGADFALSRYLP